jgi:hypothetical protein
MPSDDLLRGSSAPQSPTCGFARSDSQPANIACRRASGHSSSGLSSPERLPREVPRAASWPETLDQRVRSDPERPKLRADPTGGSGRPLFKNPAEREAVKTPVGLESRVLEFYLSELISRRPFGASTRVDAYRTAWPELPAGELRGSGPRSNVTKVTPGAGRHIAVKSILLECFNRRALEQEAQTLAMLNHPCIVRIIDWSLKSEPFVWIDELTHRQVIEIHDASYIQYGQIRTEFAEYGSLAQVLANPPAFWDATTQAVFICGLFLGLMYLHSKGLVHGNLNPSNILVTERGECLIAGFGHASIPGSSPAQTRYANRESMVGSCTVASDLFAFASIVFEIVTGRPAFPAKLSPLAVSRMLQNLQLPEIGKKGTPFVTDVIRRCWSPELDPPAFYRDTLEMLEALRFVVVLHADPLEVRKYFYGIRYWEDQQARQLRLAKEQVQV